MAENKVIQIEQEEVEVRGKTYKLQRLPTKQALELRTNWIKLDWDDLTVGEEVLKYWVIEPAKLTVNDFPVIPELMELVAVVISFQYGEKKTFQNLIKTHKENWIKMQE